MENTKKIPILIYVTKAKPYLSLDLNPQRKTYGLYRLCKHPDPSKDGEDDQDLNGLVCFECECKEVFEAAWNAGHYWVLGCSLFSKKSLLDHACVSKQELVDYGRGGKLYAYRFENVKAVDKPFPITELCSDEACVKHLTRAPQSWCHAYQKVYLNVEGQEQLESICEHADPDDEEGVKGLCVINKYIVFSIRSPFVALEANIDPKTGEPFKDLELRKARILGAGIEYK